MGGLCMPPPSALGPDLGACIREPRARHGCPPHRREVRTAAAACRRHAGWRRACPTRRAVGRSNRVRSRPRQVSARGCPTTRVRPAPSPRAGTRRSRDNRGDRAPSTRRRNRADPRRRRGCPAGRSGRPFPSRVIGVGVRPVRVIAGMESPGAIQQRRGGAQRRRIRASADRQVGDHDCQCQQRRDDDADDQFRCVASIELPSTISIRASCNDFIVRCSMYRTGYHLTIAMNWRGPALRQPSLVASVAWMYR